MAHACRGDRARLDRFIRCRLGIRPSSPHLGSSGRDDRYDRRAQLRSRFAVVGEASPREMGLLRPHARRSRRGYDRMGRPPSHWCRLGVARGLRGFGHRFVSRRDRPVLREGHRMAMRDLGSGCDGCRRCSYPRRRGDLNARSCGRRSTPPRVGSRAPERWRIAPSSYVAARTRPRAGRRARSEHGTARLAGARAVVPSMDRGGTPRDHRRARPVARWRVRSRRGRRVHPRLVPDRSGRPCGRRSKSRGGQPDPRARRLLHVRRGINRVLSRHECQERESVPPSVLRVSVPPCGAAGHGTRLLRLFRRHDQPDPHDPPDEEFTARRGRW